MSSTLLFSYFHGNGEDGLHLAHSADGFAWTALNDNRSYLVPEVGTDRLMRDPHICPGPDGRFHLVWTVSWKERGIGYACSEDLVAWSGQRYLPVMEHEPDAINCWAPEMVFDPDREEYVVFWATTIPGRFPETDWQSNSGTPGEGLNHRMYCTTTSDFHAFSPVRLFYDPGFNVIDACVVPADGRYVMFLKDETNNPFPVEKNIKLAFSDAASGPYTAATGPVTGDYWCEGPTAVCVDGTWHLYFDRYRDDTYGLLTSGDLEVWVDRTPDLRMPEGTRHGTVFHAPSGVCDGLT